MEKMLYNNELIERENRVDIEDRGYQFGDGVYEVIGIYERTPFLLDEHMVRLQRSAAAIGLELPFGMEDFKEQLVEMAKENDVYNGIIYLQVSRGIASRDHHFPDPPVQPVTVAYTREEKPLTEAEDNGASAVLTEDIRWLRCDIKSLNLLPNVMAKQEAVANGAIEAIMHRGDTVTEASASNVYIVKNGTVYTHPADNHILNGITRGKILEICARNGIPLVEMTYSVNDLLEADEVFISATKLDIVPITKVDDKVISDGEPGNVTRQIVESFRSHVAAHQKV